MEDVKGYLQIWHSDRLSHNCFLKLAGLARSSTFWRVHTMCTAYSEQVTWDGIVLEYNVHCIQWAGNMGPDCIRGQLKCDGTRIETRFRLSAKGTSPLKSVGASVQPTTGSRGVRISGSNAGYTMFRGSVKGTGYPLHSPVSSSLPLPASTCAITFQLESTS